MYAATEALQQMSAAAELLQQMHDAQQADIETLTQWQRIEYAIARRTMTHVDAMNFAKENA